MDNGFSFLLFSFLPFFLGLTPNELVSRYSIEKIIWRMSAFLFLFLRFKVSFIISNPQLLYVKFNHLLDLQIFAQINIISSQVRVYMIEYLFHGQELKLTYLTCIHNINININ